MDRFNWPCHNNGYYDLSYQEYGQHTFQPETGQTFAGTTASEALWSYPVAGQSYQGLNTPAQIPSWPRPDWETSQPAPLENIIQNDALAQPSNPQPAVRKRKRRSSAEINEHFLAGLDKYAQGYELKECSATISLYTYVTEKGYLRGPGDTLRESLTQRDKDRVDQALRSRREVLATNVTSIDCFLRGLDTYASGAPLKHCSATITYSNFVTTDGHLLKEGKAVYKKLTEGDKVLVNRALAARRRIAAKQISGDIHHFMGALEPYGNGLELQKCAEQSGLKKKVERYLTPEGGLTAKGELLIENLPLDKQLDVKVKVEQRRQLINPGAQVPESPWQLPEILASMPEMGGMDPTAMVDPIQTAPPEPSNPQPAVKKRKRMRPAEIREHFLAGFIKYAQGYELKECSAAIRFSDYVTSNGCLREAGETHYKALEQSDKNLVDRALEERQKVLAGRSVVNFRAVEGLLGGLEAYASGAPLKECSAIIKFSSYVSTKGYLHEQGESLYKSLTEQDKGRVDKALRLRREFFFEQMTTKDTTMDSFLKGLDAYASGVPLKQCSTAIRYSDFVTTDGHLIKDGQAIYKKLAGGAGEVLVNRALAARRRIAAKHISGDIHHFMGALEPYGNGLELQTCAEQSGLKKKAERYLTPEGGLTAKGELLIENLPLDKQLDVKVKVEQRRQLINPGAQVPESPWQLPEIPVSMPEMGGMDPTAMVDPIQTEAMMVAAWQYSGQAMPGIWGIPLESAEPPIPSYDREAFGADFQHHYGPYADQYPGRGV
jgi:hypothetical protein